jgi:hypothetical protein
MPIYLAEEISGSLKATTLLEERGLKMRSVPVSRLDPSAFSTTIQPVYRNYIQNISAFLVCLELTIYLISNASPGCHNDKEANPRFQSSVQSLASC